MLPFPPPPKEYQSLAEETKFEELKGLALDHKLEEAMIWAPTLPVRGGGGDPHSSFYNSSPFHGDHWRALKVNKAHSLLRMSLWGHKGWKLIGRQARCPPLRQPVSTCFTCLLILVETMLFFFFNWGRERRFRLFGNCWYLQESRYQYWYKIVVGHLCFPLFMYMSWCTWDNLSH